MSSKFIIFYVIILSSLLLVFNNLKAEYEKPYCSELIGTNLRIDRNNWNTQNISGSWVLQNLRFDEDGCFDWANWECTGVGTECRVGDWATRWSFVRSSSPGDGWIQNQNGEWEPPLPNEPGLWQSLYPLYFPLSYDPINNIYY
jgi:hypothetical protein